VGIRDQPECVGYERRPRRTALPANTPFTAPNVMNLTSTIRSSTPAWWPRSARSRETVKASLGWINNDDWRSYVKYPGSKVIVVRRSRSLMTNKRSSRLISRLINQTDIKFNPMSR